MTVNGLGRIGAVVVPTDVDDAVLGVLRTWLPTYLKLFKDQRELDYDLPDPLSITNAVDQAEWADHSLPAVIVQTAETVRTVGGVNSRQIQATWAVTINVIVRAPTPTQVRYLASYYEGAIRLCMLDKCRGGRPLKEPYWLSAKVGEVPDDTDQGRYLAAGRATYNVSTDAAAQSFGGPDVPNADVYVPTATVTTIPTITVQPAESED